MTIKELKIEIKLTQSKLAESCGSDACKIACALIALQAELIKALEADSEHEKKAA